VNNRSKHGIGDPGAVESTGTPRTRMPSGSRRSGTR